MKFTRSWLAEHLETSADLDALVDGMVRIGLEVEHVHDPSTLFAPFKTAEILEATPHPDADKLKVCTVDTGTERLQVVCGAPNARAGLKGVFAPVGSTVPGTDLLLKKAKIRGVESNGMLVSEREMGLSDEHEGIIDLPTDTPIGAPMADVMGLDDPVIDFEVTPNRPDWNGVDGIARDLAAAGLGRLVTKPVEPVAGTFACPITITLDFPQGQPPACPMFAGRVVRGVKNGPSPAWLQRKLQAIGLRPINALVDITNYVSYDRARPLHVYDAAKVQGAIGARYGRQGERFLALDGKDYDVDESMCVIADEAQVLGLGGIMGGEASGSTDATTDVFIEAALFDPIVIARTGRRLGIVSDARYRFERGVDPLFCEPGLELATRLILEVCGGEASTVTVAGSPSHDRHTIEFRPDRVKTLTGMDLGPDRCADILTALGFAITGAGDTWSVTVPSWRPDVEGEADLVEEIAHIHGYEHLPGLALPRLSPIARPVLTERQKRVRWARRLLASRGYNEAVTYSFTRADWAEAFGGGAAALSLANPISSELSIMRPSVLCNLLGAVKANLDRGAKEVALFEIGPVYLGDGADDQRTMIGGVRFAEAGRHWAGARGAPDVYDAKADALSVLSELGAPALSTQATADAPGWYHPGRSGHLRLGPKAALARFGDVHPKVLQAFGLKMQGAAFEIILEDIAEPKRKAGPARSPLALPDLMALEKDFAFLVDEGVAAETLLRAARGADKKLIVDAAIFDLYAGDGIDPGKKSVAFSVTLQPQDKTLTDDEIDAVMKKVIAAVEKATGGVLRG
ncbi:MAG: phenylalanine--tRNA ligase subunit beta [Pseudomonadota bacterium]